MLTSRSTAFRASRDAPFFQHLQEILPQIVRLLDSQLISLPVIQVNRSLLRAEQRSFLSLIASIAAAVLPSRD